MCETVAASIVDAIPKSTSSVTQPDALRADAPAIFTDTTADYKRRKGQNSPPSMRENPMERR